MGNLEDALWARAVCWDLGKGCEDAVGGQDLDFWVIPKAWDDSLGKG